MYFEEFIHSDFELKHYVGFAPWKNWYALATKVIDKQPRAWDFDMDAIKLTAESLKIKVPTLKINSNSHLNGATNMIGNKIVVQIYEAVSKQMASIILWHEFAHVRQLADGREGFQSAVEATLLASYIGRMKPYWDHPWEREAREFEINGLTIPLVKDIN